MNLTKYFSTIAALCLSKITAATELVVWSVYHNNKSIFVLRTPALTIDLCARSKAKYIHVRAGVQLLLNAQLETMV